MPFYWYSIPADHWQELTTALPIDPLKRRTLSCKPPYSQCTGPGKQLVLNGGCRAVSADCLWQAGDICGEQSWDCLCPYKVYSLGSDTDLNLSSNDDLWPWRHITASPEYTQWEILTLPKRAGEVLSCVLLFETPAGFRMLKSWRSTGRTPDSESRALSCSYVLWGPLHPRTSKEKWTFYLEN